MSTFFLLLGVFIKVGNVSKGKQCSFMSFSVFKYCYPVSRGFSWHAKNREKRKTSEDIVSKSC